MKNCLKALRENRPLIHNITNYVTVNDVANILLAASASPIMAQDSREVEEITSICGGLCINIGTLNEHSIPSMFLAGKKSNELGHPVLLDPVGVGASKLRTQTALDLIESCQFSVIRGNISEIKTLIHGNGNVKGVDADISDAVTEDNLDETVVYLKKYAKQLNSIIVVTGATDFVADAERCYVIHNGRREMGDITGTGCQLSALITALVVANQDRKLEAAATAVCMMGLAGEIGFSRLETEDGNSTYRNYIIDAIYNMNPEKLENGAKYEIL